MIKPVAPDRLRMSIADPNLRIDDGGNPDQNVSGSVDANDVRTVAGSWLGN